MASSWKRVIAARYAWFVCLAIGLDSILAFGPPLLPPSPWSYVILPIRWIVMILGAYSLIWAYREERIEFASRHRLTTYLVFGFTAAAVLNRLGVLRL